MHAALSEAKFDVEVGYLTTQFLANRNWVVNHAVYPTLDVTIRGKRDLRLRLACDNWDELPPSVDILEPDGQPLKSPPGGLFNGSTHPLTGRQFICMRGVREYHSHPSHSTELWEGYRGQDGMGLIGILDQLSRSWRRTVSG